MNAKKCDACGTLHEIYNTKRNSSEPNSLSLMNTDENNRYFSHSRIDLCPNCMGKIMEILRGNGK